MASSKKRKIVDTCEEVDINGYEDLLVSCINSGLIVFYYCLNSLN